MFVAISLDERSTGVQAKRLLDAAFEVLQLFQLVHCDEFVVSWASDLFDLLKRPLLAFGVRGEAIEEP